MHWFPVFLGAVLATTALLIVIPQIPNRFLWAFLVLAGSSLFMYSINAHPFWTIGFAVLAVLVPFAAFDAWKEKIRKGA